MVWYGMVYYGMVWYGILWYGLVYCRLPSRATSPVPAAAQQPSYLCVVAPMLRTCAYPRT